MAQFLSSNRKTYEWNRGCLTLSSRKRNDTEPRIFIKKMFAPKLHKSWICLFKMPRKYSPNGGEK